ncbi:MAG TPA: arsenosugar biosynthesis radical SAM (seleno)protein ArsS [Candidatus Sulfobium mesophilum]|nr:arsenosugar biosynthesis radical SAM (seleno)protein ArsS [Candidatus Sulfobium mesophilum]
MKITKFEQKLLSVKPEPLQAVGIRILQVNLGYRCNLACKHCHVSGGPARTEVMDEKTTAMVLRVLAENPIETLDLTGGAPELNPYFRQIVAEAKKLGRHVVVRTNLAVFFENRMEGLPEFYRDHGVELIASLPYYLEDNVDRVRGSGSFKKIIAALKQLNDLGFGNGASERSLSLMYNPQGAFLAPDQSVLEGEYKRELHNRFGISFAHLYTFTNMPIGRFRDFLQRTGNLVKYMDKLSCAFNPKTLEGIMCRSLVNVGWDGALYDCDFNQVLGLPVSLEASRHIGDFNFDVLSKRKITVDDHCYGCTAGQGSS